MSYFLISHPTGHFDNTISIASSKSISNRVLIIRALCGTPFAIHNLSNARDTRVLETLLHERQQHYHAGDGGTTIRFLTAYLATKPWKSEITGSEQLKQRPLGPLVDGLRQMGAVITYLGKKGYPPIRIESPVRCEAHEIELPADISSQFVSAILLIGPVLKARLTLVLKGRRIVSEPYIDMTIKLMRDFNADVRRDEKAITVRPGGYRPGQYAVEADWSAASYFFGITALARTARIRVSGLKESGLQGDAAIARIMQAFGVRTIPVSDDLEILKTSSSSPKRISRDFTPCPDLVQTVSVICAALGTPCHFSGLETLRIKETDRISALQNELGKVGVIFRNDAERTRRYGREVFRQEYRADLTGTPLFRTYGDHRMVMAFAMLGAVAPVRIGNPLSAEKSFPGFWKTMDQLGFNIEQDAGS